ncbi:hypothetical protein G4B88_021140 [Cannabis sativa]|uniref:Reverse transcriptase zinc-binding domain-containing protein n=1 Tax=Cannabis sativa TaxID=3483 RepID=A0A7J6HXN5_CANSA|nr:hypothetical protein G4B88_021140 [Cannabis sativa]
MKLPKSKFPINLWDTHSVPTHHTWHHSTFGQLKHQIKDTQKHANFSQADIDRILTIPLSLFPHDDVLVWNHSFTGIYNVKFGYQLVVSLAEQEDSTCSSSIEHWWSTFWKMKLPPKVRIFVWKIFHTSLLVAADLYRRHIATSPYCSICNSCEETINHALFYCPRAKSVWELSNLRINFPTLGQSSGADILLQLSSTLSTPDFELFLVLCWSIWHERNDINHGNTVRTPAAVASYASSYLQDFQAARAKRPVMRPGQMDAIFNPLCSAIFHVAFSARSFPMLLSRHRQVKSEDVNTNFFTDGVLAHALITFSLALASMSAMYFCIETIIHKLSS